MWVPPYIFILSVILADAFLSVALYDQLILLGMEWPDAHIVTFLFYFFFFFLVAALLKFLDAIMTPGSRSTSPPSVSPSTFPSTSPSTFPSSSPSSSPPALDSPPPSYCLLMEVEKGELPSYEEATK